MFKLTAKVLLFSGICKEFINEYENEDENSPPAPALGFAASLVRAEEGGVNDEDNDDDDDDINP